MNRVFLVVVIIGLLVGAIVIVGAMSRQSLNSEKVRANEEVTPEPTMNHGTMTHDAMDDHSMTVTKDSRYVEYSKDIFDVVEAQKKVLFFYSMSCETCKQADVEFMENSAKIPNGVVVVRMNYEDENTDNMEKAYAGLHGVVKPHTFIQIDSKGLLVTRWEGGQLNELLKNIK